MVEIDKNFEQERDRGEVPKRRKKTPRVHGSDIERKQEGRVARGQQPDATQKPGFNRWKNT